MINLKYSSTQSNKILESKIDKEIDEVLVCFGVYNEEDTLNYQIFCNSLAQLKYIPHIQFNSNSVER
jgi:hypothetical protein